MAKNLVEIMDTTLRDGEQLQGIGAVFFDVTHKPPATIEWE